jgi:hypothetical protein
MRRRQLILQAIRLTIGNFHWGVEIWPLQWRISASWLAGYALVLMHVPLLFRTQGAVVAGQMGVTITVANMLSILTLSWMTASTPSMTRLITMKNWLQLDHVYWRVFRLSCAVFVAGAALFIFMRLLIESTAYGVRFLPVKETVGLLIAMGFYHVSGLFANYLRAHLREPFLWPSLIGAILTASAAILVAPIWGATGVVIVLLVVNSIFYLPISLWLWIHLRKKWHLETV